MTVTQPGMTPGPQPGVPEASSSEPLIPWKVKAVMVALVVAVFGFICYGIGTNHGTGSHVLIGRAYVSPDQVGVKVNGWSYGFEMTGNSMDWYDTHGASHEGGIPPCLQHGPRWSWIRFGWSTATGLDNDSWRVVTWVQCISHG